AVSMATRSAATVSVIVFVTTGTCPANAPVPVTTYVPAASGRRTHRTRWTSWPAVAVMFHDSGEVVDSAGCATTTLMASGSVAPMVRFTEPPPGGGVTLKSIGTTCRASLSGTRET